MCSPFCWRKMKQEKLKLYSVDMKYVRDLHRADDKVQSVSPQIHKSLRPFIGVVIICGERQHCIPLDHPKEKHISMKNSIDFLRIFDGEKLIGVMNLNNMIPVDETVISVLRVKPENSDKPEEAAYKRLCAKELDWIQKNHDVIIHRAQKLYRIMMSGKASYGLKNDV